MRLLVVVLLASASAGCLEDAGSPGPAEAGAEPMDEPLVGDLFFVRSAGGEDWLDRVPDAEPMEARSAFASGGGECQAATPPPVGHLTEPCWSRAYPANQSLSAAHASGDVAQLTFWLTMFLGPGQLPVTLEAWLFADGREVAHGVSEAQATLEPALPLVASNCAAWSVSLPLTASLEPGQEVSLVVLADGAFAEHCNGGGTDGSRLDLGVGPPPSSGAPS